jgi:NADH-quinone oxidoreductase subunit F
MAITDAPKIVTARLGFDDSHTLERYLATGGYEGLRKALKMTPEAVAHEVDTASLLGRGGAGFPAGRKWSMLRMNAVTYLVINGDESEPATFKDHLLIERDPHQIIEGVLISAYALQVTQAFIYLRGEFALGLERLQSALKFSGRASRSMWWSTPAQAPTSAVRRRHCWSRWRASAVSPA